MNPIDDLLLKYQTFFEKFGSLIYKNIILSIILLLSVFIILKLIRFLFKGWYTRGKISLEYFLIGNKLIKYFIIVIVIIIWLDTLGVKVTILLTTSTAFFVGIGLGLQKLFQDIVSGIIIVFEKTLHINDVLTVDDKIVKVISIKLRTSRVISREDEEIIIPNYKLVSENVINWTTNGKTSRFVIPVGVAYGTDVEKVKNLLIAAAKTHLKVKKLPSPIVQLIDFGSNSLDFKLLFYSDEIFRIEIVKSDIRYTILKYFNEHNIVIAFPQQDVYIKNFPQTSDK